MKKMMRAFVLFLVVSSPISVSQAEGTRETGDLTRQDGHIFGRLSSGIKKLEVPTLYNFGDIIYNGEEQSVSKNIAGGKVSFEDNRGFILQSTSNYQITNEEINELKVLEDGIPQITTSVEGVPEWLKTATIDFKIGSSQADLEKNEGQITLNEEVNEPFEFKGDIDLSKESELHGSNEETGYFKYGRRTKEYTFSNVKLNLPAGIDVPPGKQTIDLKIKWNLVYTP